jgi:hypothetical protein
VWRAPLRPHIRADAYNHLLVPHVPETIGQLLPDLHRCSARRLRVDPRATEHLHSAISKRIIEMHGEKIWVDSILGQGSTFSFTLPMKSNNNFRVREELHRMAKHEPLASMP